MGMSGDTALTLAKNYVKKTLQGQGALKGQDGFSPIVTENKDNADEIYKLDITTKDGTFTTPNLKGFIGADGFSPIATVTKVGNTTTITLTDKNGTTSEMIMDGETNIIESITVNGVAVPISDKTVNIDLSGYVEKEDGKTLVSASDVSQIRKNKDDIATLNGTGDGSVDKKIADKLSEQTYLTKKIITADEARAYIADPHTAKFNIIYLVKDESASGSDKYFEYQRIGTEESSTFEMTGDTSTNLADYAKSAEIPTTVAELTDSADYAKKTDIPTTLPADGGNADTVNNHTVKSDVPENAVFTDTVYDDTEVKGSIEDLSSNLVELKVSDTSGGKNLQNVNSIVVKKAEVYITDYLLPIGTYTISFVSDTSGGIDFYSKELSDGIIGGIACQLKENQRVSKTFTVNSPTRLCSYSNITATLTEIQIEKGSLATPYEPYIPSVKMLAEEVAQQNTEAMDLKMLGWTVPKECPIQNEVNGNQFIQKVGRVDLGSLEWTYLEDNLRFYATITERKPIYGNNTDIYCSKYATVIISSDNADKTIGSAYHKTPSDIGVRDLSYTDATAFKSANNGVYVYYELATPITMTIDGNEVTERINESLSVIGKCKNLLKPTLQTTTQNGVTCTANGDGTYTLNGTASSDIVLALESYKSYTGKEKFRLVGCPNGGGESKYYLAFRPNNAEENRKDIGSGVTFNDLSTSNKYAVAIIVLNGTTVTNLTFKPMLVNLDEHPELSNITYDDFVPYTGDGDTLTHDVAEIKNDLVPKKIELQNVDERVTIQDNGSFIINGFAFVNLLVTFNETLPQWSNFVRLPRPKGDNISVHCENSVILAIYSQDNLPGDCGTTENVASGTEIRLLVNYEVA